MKKIFFFIAVEKGFSRWEWMAGKLVIWVTCFQRLMSRPFLSEDNPHLHIFARIWLWVGTKWQEAVHFSLYIVIHMHNQTDRWTARATGTGYRGERQQDVHCNIPNSTEDQTVVTTDSTGDSRATHRLSFLQGCWCDWKSLNRFPLRRPRVLTCFSWLSYTVSKLPRATDQICDTAKTGREQALDGVNCVSGQVMSLASTTLTLTSLSSKIVEMW